MNNFVLTVMLISLVGCGEPTNFVTMPDSGIVGDGAVAPDAWENADAGMPGTDSGIVEADAEVGHDAAVMPMADAGTDASMPAADAGVDAYVPPTTDAGTPRGTAVELGVSGIGTCVLTSTRQMWCWGGSMATPTYVADAVALEGNCAIGTDGRPFCVGADAFGVDSSVVGAGGYVRRADGVFEVDLGAPYGSLTWTPPSAIEELPTTNCGILADGTARCWDIQFTTGSSPTAMFSNYMNLGAANDVARAGNIFDNSFRACTVDSSGTHCVTTRGTTGSALLNRGVEVELTSNRACSLVTSAWTGPDDLGHTTYHDVGVYCTTSTPTTGGTGYIPFNTLSTSDLVGDYTNINGTQLRLGSAHACVLNAGHVQCWGDGSHNQLGGVATTRTPVTVF